MPPHADPTADAALTPTRRLRPAAPTVQCSRCGALGQADDSSTWPETADGGIEHMTSRVVGTEGSYRRQSRRCEIARVVA